MREKGRKEMKGDERIKDKRGEPAPIFRYAIVVTHFMTVNFVL